MASARITSPPLTYAWILIISRVAGPPSSPSHSDLDTEAFEQLGHHLTSASAFGGRVGGGRSFLRGRACLLARRRSHKSIWRPATLLTTSLDVSPRMSRIRAM